MIELMSSCFFFSLNLFAQQCFSLYDHFYPLVPVNATANHCPDNHPPLHLYERKPNSAESKDDMVFFHGALSSHRFWQHAFIPHLPDSIVDKHHIIAPDLLGFGESPGPAELLFTMEHHLQLLEHSLIEQRNLQSIHLVGYSLGGMVAAAFAARHPDRVKSLQLFSVPHFESASDADAHFVNNRFSKRRVIHVPVFITNPSIGSMMYIAHRNKALRESLSISCLHSAQALHRSYTDVCPSKPLCKLDHYHIFASS